MEARIERRRLLIVLSLLLGLGSQEWLAQMRQTPTDGNAIGKEKKPGAAVPPLSEDVSGGESVDGLPGVVVRQHHAAAQALVTTVLRASVVVNENTEGFQPATLPTTPTFATPLDCDTSALPSDFTALLDIIARIQALMKQDTHLAAQISRVREAFGDGELLEVLFRQLFPGQKTRPFITADGKPLLTKAEVRVLREAARDFSHDEIAAQLGISPNGVRTHFNHIYSKLDVNRPLRAVGKAISMGYLEMDALDIVRSITQNSVRNYSLFNALMSIAPSLDGPPRAGGMRPLAEFGLFLVALSGIGEKFHEDAISFPSYAVPAMVQIISRQGQVIRSFGQDFLYGHCTLTMIPPHAARQGFTPGNLLVEHDIPPGQGVNAAVITEFTPEGKVVRSFGGGQEIGSRLYGAMGMAFHVDGRLLVPSGAMTDCLLAFSDGGRKVERWVNGVCTQVAVGLDGRVYTAGTGGATTLIRVYAPSGEQVLHFALLPEGSNYTGIAVTSQGRIWVNRWHGPEQQLRLVEFAPQGEQQRALALPGMDGCHLHRDAQDRLYVPCARSKDIKILDASGAIVERIALDVSLVPYSVVTNGNGCLYVTGLIDGGA